MLQGTKSNCNIYSYNSPELHEDTLTEEVLPWRLSDTNDVDVNTDDEGNTGDETSFVTIPLHNSDGKEVLIKYGSVANNDSAYDTWSTGGDGK